MVHPLGGGESWPPLCHLAIFFLRGVPFTQSAVALIILSVKQRTCSVEHSSYETEFSWLIKQHCNSLIKPVLSASKCKEFQIALQKVKGYDCTEIFAENPNAESGVYLIKPEKVAKPFKVFCEKREDGGWTIFQRRHGKGENGQPVNFMRVWDSYKQRFGHVTFINEHWLGLDCINALSQQPGKVCQLRVDMMSCKEELAYVLYDTFKIGNESELCQISLGNFTGNVGDAFRGTEEFGDQNGHNFTTCDRDNDGCNVCITGGHAYTNCAQDIGYSGWWFSHCGMANLNGEWHTKETS
ncbi:unnamed protein product [Eretmochelys imbricata]